MTLAGIRELKDNLSQYVRRAEAGERVGVTAHGRVVAELGPVGAHTSQRRVSRLDTLISAGLALPATHAGDPTGGWPSWRLPKGTVKALVEADRGDD